jgi:hypothetical protein
VSSDIERTTRRGTIHVKRTTRLLGAVAAATIAAVVPLSATIAAAQDANGVGTGTVRSTLLQVDVGDAGGVLSVRVLTDEGTSTIDPANGAPVASTSVVPLTISSSTVPGLALSTPALTSTSSGPEDRQDVGPGLPSSPAFSGSVGGTISSIVDAAGARSGFDAAVGSLLVAGGLLSVPSGTATLGTNAATGSTAATRSLSIPAIEVLNLAAVLEGAGLALTDLPLDTLLGLLGGLGIALPEIPDPGGVIETVNGVVDSLQGQTGPLTSELCTQVDGLLGTVGGLAGTGAVGDVAEGISDAIDDITGGGTGGGLPGLPDLPDLLGAQALPITCDAVTGTVEELVDDLQAVVASVLTSVLDALGSTSLLSVQGIQLGVVADAKSTVESSVAEVTGTIGSVKVGAVTVPGVSGLDLTAAADVLNGAGNTVSAAVGQVLGLVNAQLADMVDVDVMQIDELVGADGAYASATAAVTAVRATITPPGLLTGALDLSGTAGDILGEAAAAVPALAPVMSQLEVALGGLDVLTSPTTITIGRIESTSAFQPVSAAVPAGTAPTSSGELPRTGSDAAAPAIAAVLVAGVALGIRRFVASLAAMP